MFSVVMVDYDGTMDRKEFKAAVACFADQTDDDFELLIYHDGPKQVPYSEELKNAKRPKRLRCFETSERENNWGHSNRDRGIRTAKGDWIIHTNADNVFYGNAIASLKAKIADDSSTMLNRREETKRKDIVIFPIILRGATPVKGSFIRRPDMPGEFAMVLSGVPVSHKAIDAMQFVMRRELWLNEGGWSDLSKDSDGFMYEKFARKYAMHQVLEVLGEHW